MMEHMRTQRDFGVRSSAYPERVRFLDISRCAWERGDAHLAFEKLPRSGKVSDCSHYCSAATDAWSLMMQHALCNGDTFEFEHRECDAPTLKSVPGRKMNAALRKAIAARYSLAGSRACPAMGRSDADAAGVGDENW